VTATLGQLRSRFVHRRAWPVVTVFVCIILIQVLVTVLSINLLSAVRSYVTGESLYSKGQKDAQVHLLDYAAARREEDYHKFEAALAAPLGDRLAREELQKPNPDFELARRGLLQGGNHPDDLDWVMRLFRWFHKSPLMAPAIKTWDEGDRVIEAMRSLAARARERILAGDLGAPAVAEIRAQAPVLNDRLSLLERRFSQQLGDASRLAQRSLLAVNLSLAVLLGLTGLAFVRHSTRRQALTEEELRQRRASLQRLLDSAAEGLFGVDTKGRCTFVNHAALSMLRYGGEEELIGRDIHALIHRPGVRQAGAAPRPSRFHLAYSEGRQLHYTDEVFWRQDGSSFPVEYWSYPMHEDGVIQGAVATFFDISERLRMQAALLEGERRMAALVDAVNDGIIAVDAEARIVHFNNAAERLFLMPAANAMGKPIEDFIPALSIDERTPMQRDLFGDVAGRPAAMLHELTGQRSNGEEFPIEASLSPVESPEGRLVTIVLRDVTEQHLVREERRAREAVEATNRAKTDFLSRMSHELRTPLNAVLGFSQLMRFDAKDPPTRMQLERINHIENAGNHLLALVNDVLDLSRIESGQMMLRIESVDVCQAANDAVAMVSPLAARAGVTLVLPAEAGAHRSADTALLRVWADRVRLLQVLVNLLSNAVKYNRSGGSARLEWRLVGEICELSVTDTGPGMTAENLARLFEPFNRLGAESTRIEGTGIGLVLSRRMIELMEGRLTIKSAVGDGTTATVVLKASHLDPVGVPGPSAPSQHGTLDDRLEVVYAEDNEVNVELVKQLVSLRPAVTLRVANDGRSALSMALRQPPDMMLVDMNLGDMTGMELAQELRRRPGTAGIRLVALSADALPEQINAALAAGFEAYLTKPIEFRKLLKTLDWRPNR
jgi:PAS domain S-box-containing protein